MAKAFFMSFFNNSLDKESDFEELSLTGSGPLVLTLQSISVTTLF